MVPPLNVADLSPCTSVTSPPLGMISAASVTCCVLAPFVLLYDAKEVDRLIGVTTENELRGRLASAAAPPNRSASQVPTSA